MEIERELVYWFKDGTLYSGKVLGSMILSFNVTEEDDLTSRNCAYRTTLSNPDGMIGFDESLINTMKMGWNNRKILMVTGCRMVPEDETAPTKEDAFKKYMECIASDHGLMV